MQRLSVQVRAGDGQAVEQPPAGQSLCPGENTDGLRESRQEQSDQSASAVNMKGQNEFRIWSSQSALV